MVWLILAHGCIHNIGLGMIFLCTIKFIENSSAVSAWKYNKQTNTVYNCLVWCRQ